MKIRYSRYIITLSFLLLLAWTISCSGRAGIKSEAVPSVTAAAVNSEAALNLIKLVSPEENAEFKLNQPVEVIIELKFRNKVPDSVAVFFNSKIITTLKSEPWKCSVSGELTKSTGRKSLKVIAYKDGKMQNPIARFLVFYSDVVPKMQGYKVINSYPHDRRAFTQGLFYYKGSLFESTGQETESSLREVELTTGKVIRQLNIESSLFGEGITLCKDRIFQVTWRNKVGFVYDKDSFKQINKIFYPTEGWGLTTMDDRIVMSDGTNILYFYEPEMFTVISKIEVYDNEKMIDSLNELEFINGEIWANIWMQDLIARIDPVSGKVKGYINLQGILSESDRNPDSEVLNGIAYDKDTKRIFVTGKRWPKLYEIRIIE
jgi:glutaminyl-peptide cyclotransferase